MKFYNYSIYIFLFIFSTTSLRAQDVTITDTDIILDQNNNIIPGQIIFDFDEGTFDMHIYQLTALSYPVGSGCAPVYNEQVIDDDDFTIILARFSERFVQANTAGYWYKTQALRMNVKLSFACILIIVKWY